MKVDAAQPLSTADENRAFTIEQEQAEKKSYLQDLRRSCRLVYLTRKSFDEKHWKLAFCASSFEFINKYPNIFLLYRTVLLVLTFVDLVHGIATTRPIHEWAIYFTHLTLAITCLAICFQFLTTCRVNFFRGDNIVPRPAVQCIHLILIVISLGIGLGVCLAYWLFIYHPSTSVYYPRIIFDHGVLWALFFVDIFLFTRLPIYLIDSIPLVIFALLYAIFTIAVFLFKVNFSRARIGHVYRAFDFNRTPVVVALRISAFVFVLPVVMIFLLWNLFRLRRSIDVNVPIEEEQSNESLVA